jgi:hypothetical protein
MADNFEGKFGHIEKLPEEIREAFVWLAHEVVALFRKWDFYLGLFANEEHRQTIAALPQPFQAIEQALRTDLIMLIGRLDDGATFKDDENVSFRALAEFYPDDKELELLVVDFSSAAKPVKTNRHKTVAHTDKKIRLSTYDDSIPQITKADIDANLQKAQEIINHVSWNYAGHRYGFGFEGDSSAVSATLKLCVKLRSAWTGCGRRCGKGLAM